MRVLLPAMTVCLLFAVGSVDSIAVAQSDNVAADLLLRVIGGPQALNDYLAGLGISGFHLQDGEHALRVLQNQAAIIEAEQHVRGAIRCCDFDLFVARKFVRHICPE